MWIQGHRIFWLLTLVILNSWICTTLAQNSPDLEEFKRLNSDLTEFLDEIVNNPQFNSALEYKQGTIFIPTNNVLSEFKRAHPNDDISSILLYHFVNTPTILADFEETSIATELPGNLPIWVTKIGSDVYLNSAKIIRHDRKVRIGKNNMEQIVHAINKVLEPAIPTDPRTTKLNNPDAKKFLEGSAGYTIAKPYQTTIFANRVNELIKMDFFHSSGRHTFFLPVDEAFVTTRIGSVDKKVIDGHKIDGKSIFLGVNDGSNEKAVFETSNPVQNYRVSIEFSKTSNTWSVTSENLDERSGEKHRKVQAQIYKANIPVKNGVIHLISRPLVVIDSDVYKLMQGDDKNGPMRKFFEIIEMYPNVKKILSEPSSQDRFTIFVPTSFVVGKATNFQELFQRTINRGPEQDSAKKQMEQILKLHIVPRDLTSDQIITGSKNTSFPFSVKTLADQKELYFQVNREEGDNRDVIHVVEGVDGGGTSAVIKQADIGATNGVIHLIGRVLGIGDNTIHDRLETDPRLVATFNISKQEKFHEIFKMRNKKFTFFAPYNEAWEGVLYESPSKHRILFEGLHGGHSKLILERHLIVGREVSLEDLYSESVTGNKTIEVRQVETYLGAIRVVSVDDPNFANYSAKYGVAHPRKNQTRFHGEYKYVIFWENKQVRVVQGDIKCSNGYIHIIDTVLMTPSDVTVNSAREILNSSVLTYLLPIFLSLILL